MGLYYYYYRRNIENWIQGIHNTHHAVWGQVYILHETIENMRHDVKLFRPLQENSLFPFPTSRM